MKTALRYLVGLFSMVLSGNTRADQMEIDSREKDDSSVKNFPTLRAALIGGELPIPGSMQVETGDSLGQDAITGISHHKQGEGTGVDKGSLLAPPAHFQPKKDPTHPPLLVVFHQSENT